MNFGLFPKGLALLLIPTLQYFRYDEFWAVSKEVSLAFDANLINIFDMMIFGHFRKGLALLLMTSLQYYRYDEFWAFVKRG